MTDNADLLREVLTCVRGLADAFTNWTIEDTRWKERYLRSQSKVPSKLDEGTVSQAVGALRLYAEAQVRLGNQARVHRSQLIEFVKGQHPELEGSDWLAPAMKVLVNERTFEHAGKTPGSGLFRPTFAKLEAPSKVLEAPSPDPEGTSNEVSEADACAEWDRQIAKIEGPPSKAHLQPSEHWKEILEVRERDIDPSSNLPRSRAFVDRQRDALAARYDPKVRPDDGSWAIIEQSADSLMQQIAFYERQQRENLQ
jgi:hypothetical protein